MIPWVRDWKSCTHGRMLAPSSSFQEIKTYWQLCGTGRWRETGLTVVKRPPSDLSPTLCIILDFSLCDSRMLPNLYWYMFVNLFLWQFFFKYISCAKCLADSETRTFVDYISFCSRYMFVYLFLWQFFFF